MSEPIVITPISQSGNPPPPPDLAERRQALDPTRSFLVQAPAGSGKTYLLTQRFLRLLGQAQKPEEIVAITFTKAAAAEMRGRVLAELEKAEHSEANEENSDSMAELARTVLERSRGRDWRLLELPGQLRITTIDAFCRSIALQCPLSWGGLTELGGRLESVEKPEDLYRQAAMRTLQLLESTSHPVRRSVEELLRLRDNNWKDVENLLVKMLHERNRWFQEFVFLQSEATEEDWVQLRRRLEKPFRHEAMQRLERLGRILDGLPDCREWALKLAREACETPGEKSPIALAERAELPKNFSADIEEELALLLEDGLDAYGALARFLQTEQNAWRKKAGLNKNHGYPPDAIGKAAKERLAEFIESLAQEPGLETVLATFQHPIPVRYTDEEWALIRHSFAVMRIAWGQLQAVFVEAGSVDFTEVARIALQTLAPVDGFPSEFALRFADGIRHLLIDEFQDTSRNQHQLLARVVGAWADRENRSVFCVGDPMQSIYGFRDAEVELFERLKNHGLELQEPFEFQFLRLTANFRTIPTLVQDLNDRFQRIFAEDDGSGVRFTPAVATRAATTGAKATLHLAFSGPGADPLQTKLDQLAEMTALIQKRLTSAKEARVARFRVAVLGRTKNTLKLVAEALHEADIGFRAIDLVPLKERPEVLDALALVQAIMNDVNRTAWLGVLRAPWCGLTLEELHLLTSADDPIVMSTPIPEILQNRLEELSTDSRLSPRAFQAASRVAQVMRAAKAGRMEAAPESLGTWVESVWKALGGSSTVNREQRENLDLLWRSLDRLVEGEVDLLGQGLQTALDGLFALPNPEVSEEFGVQLMTIHHSKGLEFEAVIVPELESATRNNDPALLSWLERGLTGSEDDEELTEFLIAPIQSKGGDAGDAKAWVDSVRRMREKQEMRRILYVAATRAREELHLFARLDVQDGKEGLRLTTPKGLLATAWPALEEEVAASFAEWQTQRSEVPISDLAAGAEIITMPPIRRPTLLRRLPETFSAPGFGQRTWNSSGTNRAGIGTNSEVADEPLYTRTEGGVLARLEGTAVHTLLEKLSRFRLHLGPAEALAALQESIPGLTASLRSRGLTAAAAEQLVEKALLVVGNMASHPVGAWMIFPHPEAFTEVGWTGLVRDIDGQERLANLRPDRVFYAALPGEKASSWWIVDYKTSHAAVRDISELSAETQKQAFSLKQRERYQGQLAAYVQVLRGLLGAAETPIRAGIYYPRINLFDFWEA